MTHAFESHSGAALGVARLHPRLGSSRLENYGKTPTATLSILFDIR
jgi:hypothetical protein